MRKTVSPADAVERLELLCVRSEQCTSDLRRKLFTWGITPSQSDTILNGLEQRGFVDDSRFARAYVRDKYRFSRWGRQKIVAGLIAKRIPRHIIDSALSEIQNKEYALTAFRAIAAKLRTLDTTMPRHELRAKLLRHAIAKGYESALILKILDSNRLWAPYSN